MNTSTVRKAAASALAVAALVTVGASAASAEPAEAAKPPRVSLTGSARLHYAAAPRDDVRVSFDTHATYPEWGQNPVPGAVRGTMRISHEFAGHGITGWAEARVDCVVATGGVALVTGDVIRHSDTFAGWEGKRIGFTVVDAGPRDQVGFTGPVDDLGACFGEMPKQSPAPVMVAQQGGFKLKHDLPPVY
ncbi:hypothetical protein [Thermomonospora cellulosilytica]|nr:hypothetical protein [Thermomonospora cellulosilytica]